MAWNQVSNIKGPKGDAGVQGVQGIQGTQGPAGTAADIATLTHAAVSKATPVDVDELPLIDSAASWGLKRLTWANLKTALQSLFFHRGNILGTVSQTGGVPTGAIVQSGSNANGSYIRYADGTQMCWFNKAIAELAITADNYATQPAWSWTYPVAFVATPMVIPKLAGNYASQVGIAQANTSATAATDVYMHNYFTSTATVGGPILYFAIGRWY